jgi:hypothetical protein
MKKVEWTNEIPKESGYYWSCEKTYIDGELTNEYGPEVVYIDIEADRSTIVSSCGSDDCDFVARDKTHFILEMEGPRDAVFRWDDEETRKRKRADIVKSKYIRLVRPIKIVEIPKEGEY